MKKTIWADWSGGVICTCKEQLAEEYKNSDTFDGFGFWLNENYTASDVWEANTEVKAAIEQEYQRYYDACLTDFINDYFEAIEIEV